MTQLEQRHTLPAAIAEKLDAVRRRSLIVRLGTAIVVAVVVLLAAMAVAMLVDWLTTIYDFRWRAFLTYSTWVAAGATLLVWAVAAWRHTRTFDQVAAKVDREIPELEERWSTVTSLSRNGSSPTNGQAGQSHPAMFNQVSTEAQKWTPRVESERVVPLDGLIRALLFLTATTLILGLAVVFDSGRTGVLLKRFWQPYTAISATELIDLTEQKVIGRGESLQIEANLLGAAVQQASLILEPSSGEAKTIALVPRGKKQDRLTHRLRAVKEPLRYRLRAGDGQTDWCEIVVADRPQLANVQLTLTPPAYTRRDPKILNKLPRRVTALEGSHIAIAFKPKQSLQSLQLKLGPEQREQLTADEQGWYRWETTLKKSFTFQPLLIEEHGLTNLRPPNCEIKCRPDKPPVVKILTPNSQMAVRPDETIPVTFVASDDVGVQQAELIVYDETQRVDGKPRVLDRISVPLGEQQGAVKVKATVDLDLSQYQTMDGSVLSFSIRVREDRGQELLANRQNKPADAIPTQPMQAQTPSAPQSGQETPQNELPLAEENQIAETQQANAKATVASAEKNASSQKPAQSQQANTQQANTTQDTSPEQNTETAASSQSSKEALGNSPNENAIVTAGQGEDAPKATQAASSQPSKKMSEQQQAAGIAEPTSEKDELPAAGMATQDNKAQNSSLEIRTASTGRQALNTDTTEPQESQKPGELASKKPEASQDSMAKNLEGTAPSEQSDQQTEQPKESSGEMAANINAKSSANSGEETSSQRESDTKPSNRGQVDQSNTAAASQPQKQSPSGSSNDPSDSQQASSPPENPMTRRSLDVPAAQSSTSQRMRLQVDEEAGSYDGQQRIKLELAIAPHLDDLDKALEKAQALSRSVLEQTDAGEPWTSQLDRSIQQADKQIGAAIGIVKALEEQTYDTPYAFIGLQLVDINQAHIGPARRDFWKAMQSDDAARVEPVRNGWQHTTRARELLTLLTERFTRTKTEYKMADAVQKVKKMYNIFVEDTMNLLRPPGDGDRYSRKMVEFDLDEDYLKRLEEVEKMRNEMRAELARILSDDPRLLRRFLDAERNRNKVLRNDLDRLIEKQGDLNRESRAWEVAEAERRPQLAAILLGRHIESAHDLAIAAAELHDRFETWSPLGKEVEDADFRATTEVLQTIATATSELSADGTKYVTEQIRAKKIEEGEEGTADGSETAATAVQVDSQESAEKISGQAQQLYEQFTQLEVLLRRISSREGSVEIGFFATNRLLETRRLIEQTSAWIRQLKQQQAGNYHRSAEVAQYRLAMETDVLAGKLADIEQTMAGLLQRDDGQLPQSIAEKSRRLLAVLDEQVAPNQLGAVYDLRRNRMSRATRKQGTAHEGLTLAAKLYDEMIEAAIIELDKLPVQDPIASLLDDPTLDELLRALEQETPIQELLGIPQRPSNLRIMSDWLRSGGDNSLMAGGMGAMMEQMQRQQELRQRQLEKAYRKAVSRALKETLAEDLVTDMPKLAAETADWNRLASQLEDDLRQGAGKAPPERYRRAIEQYFRQVSGAEPDSE